MTGSQRRDQIRALLSTNEQAISATTFAKKFAVSRQTIVGDISLLRANGVNIIATLHGYELDQVGQPTAIIVCRHSPSDTVNELKLIVNAGGIVKNVEIEHPLYGRLSGELEIRTVGDVNLFIGRLQNQHGHLLSELTDGIHTHTIAYQTLDQLKKIKEALRKADFLYEN